MTCCNSNLTTPLSWSSISNLADVPGDNSVGDDGHPSITSDHRKLCLDICRDRNKVDESTLSPTITITYFGLRPRFGIGYEYGILQHIDWKIMEDVAPVRAFKAPYQRANAA